VIKLIIFMKYSFYVLNVCKLDRLEVGNGAKL